MENSCGEKLLRCFKNHVRSHLTKRLFAVMIGGQFLSLLICSAGVGSQKLVTACGVKVPAFQGFLMYTLLSTVFTSQVAYNGRQTMHFVKERWWKYMIIALIDVTANYTVFTAYQYTSLTSIQLLDCLTIPIVVILSIVVLKAKYRPTHFFGVFTCLAGVGFLVWADSTGSRHQGPKPGDRRSELYGDIFVSVGAVCYGVVNVAEEFVVKTSTMTEFLGMMSLFASFFSAVNVYVLEKDSLSVIIWNYEAILFLALSVLSLCSFYVLMPIVISHTSATLVNLTLLTADLYAFFAGLYLFNFVFSSPYIASFIFIMVGVVIFIIFPTPSHVDAQERENAVNLAATDSEEESLLTSQVSISFH